MKSNYENFNWNNIEPLVLEHQLLMSPGVWNGNYYSADEIEKAYDMTEWEDEHSADLYYDHMDKAGESAQNWIGLVKNITKESSGRIYGDLHIIHPVAAAQVALSNFRKKLGISPTVYGDKINQTIRDFAFKTFSLVRHPAIKTAFLNSEKEEDYEVIQEGLIRDTTGHYFINNRGDLCKLKDKMTEKNTLAVMPTEKRKQLPTTQFAYPAGKKLPINDPEHVRNALARWNQTQLPEDQKIPVLRKIITAAKKFGIKVSDDMLKKAGFKTEKMEEKMDIKKELDELKEKIAKLEKLQEETTDEDTDEKKEETPETPEEPKKEEKVEDKEEPKEEVPKEEPKPEATPEEKPKTSVEENDEDKPEPKTNDEEEMKELLLDPNASSFVRDHVSEHKVSLSEAYSKYKESKEKQALEMREELKELKKRDFLGELTGNSNSVDQEMLYYLKDKANYERGK